MTTAEQAHLEQDSLDILAGEFVLGTLNETARRQCTLLASANPAFAERIRFWQTILAPLARTPVPVSPLGDLWQQIARLTVDAPKPVTLSPVIFTPPPLSYDEEDEQEVDDDPRTRTIWRSLAIGLACLAIVLAGTLIVVLDHRASWQSHRFAVLVDAQREPVWLARSDATGHQLEIAPIRRIAIPADKVFQLWMTAGPNTPAVSLGLLSPEGEIIPKLPSSFAQARTLLVSIEPIGGSAGAPSGDPSAVGTLVDPSEPARPGR